jgi:hypothetical protein
VFLPNPYQPKRKKDLSKMTCLMLSLGSFKVLIVGVFRCLYVNI